MKAILAFTCSYCADRTLYHSRTECLSHEKICTSGPVARGCLSCALFRVTDTRGAEAQHPDLELTEYHCGACVPQGRPIVFGCRAWQQKSVS